MTDINAADTVATGFVDTNPVTTNPVTTNPVPPASTAPVMAAPPKRGVGRKIVAGLVLVAQVAIVLGLGFVLVGIAGGTTRMGPVVTGSMGEAVPVGSLVVATKKPTEQLAVGDILLFSPPQDPNGVIIHRIIEMQDADGIVAVTTKGDANLAVDPWAPMTITSPEAWVYSRHIDGAGAVLQWVNQNMVMFLGIVIGMVLVINAIMWVTKPRKTATDASPAS